MAQVGLRGNDQELCMPVGQRSYSALHVHKYTVKNHYTYT